MTPLYTNGKVVNIVDEKLTSSFAMQRRKVDKVDKVDEKMDIRTKFKVLTVDICHSVYYYYFCQLCQQFVNGMRFCLSTFLQQSVNTSTTHNEVN